MNKRGMEPLTIALIAIGAMAVIIISLFILIKLPAFHPIKPTESNINSCMKVILMINKASSKTDTITIQRLAGGTDIDVVGIKAFVDGESVRITSPQDLGLKQLETKTYKLDYDLQKRDEIEVAAVVGEKQLVCNPVNSAKAD